MGARLLRGDIHWRQGQPGDHQGERVHLRGQRSEIRTQGVSHEGTQAVGTGVDSVAVIDSSDQSDFFSARTATSGVRVFLVPQYLSLVR